jgi:hypothetical protein
MRTVFFANLLAGMALASASAHADGTRFLCSTEEATNSVAEKLVLNQQAADDVAKPFINEGVCLYLPSDVRVRIVYHGKVYGEHNFRIEVVGFMDSDNTHMLYALMPKAQDSI